MVSMSCLTSLRTRTNVFTKGAYVKIRLSHHNIFSFCKEKFGTIWTRPVITSTPVLRLSLCFCTMD